MQRTVTKKRVWTGIQVLIAVGLIVVGYLALSEPTPPLTLIGPAPAPLAPAQTGGGVSLAVQSTNPGIKEVGAQWYFNWSHTPHQDVDLAFVPLICGYPGNRQVSDAHLEQIEAALRADPAAYPDGTLFLIGNEIGYTHQQDERTARAYAEDFHTCHTLLRSINPTYRVSVGPTILSTDEGITSAIVGAEDGIDYLRQVIREYQRLYGEVIPTEYFAATNHVLRADAANLEVFKRRLVELRMLLAEEGLRDRRVILTEFGVPTRGSSPEAIEWFMGEAIRFVATATDADLGHPDDGKLVQEWAWFTTRPLTPLQKVGSLGVGAFFLQLAPTALYTNDGSLTHLGHVYAAMMQAE